jgi:hypothetical protein
MFMANFGLGFSSTLCTIVLKTLNFVRTTLCLIVTHVELKLNIRKLSLKIQKTMQNLHQGIRALKAWDPSISSSSKKQACQKVFKLLLYSGDWIPYTINVAQCPTTQTVHLKFMPVENPLPYRVSMLQSQGFQGFKQKQAIKQRPLQESPFAA